MQAPRKDPEKIKLSFKAELMRDRLNACSKGLLEFEGEIFILRGVAEEKTLERCVDILRVAAGRCVRSASALLVEATAVAEVILKIISSVV
jgi:hypothetical protein